MKKIRIVLITLFIIALFTGCKAETDSSPITDTQFKFNTVMTITLYGYNDQSVFKEVWAEFDKMEQTYSANLKDSDVTKFNDSTLTAPISVSSDIVEMVSKAQPYSEATHGKFDLTIEPVVKLWGISTENPSVPAQNDLDNALKHVDYTNVVPNTVDKTLTKKDMNSRIDLGAIAKGYAADKIVDFLKGKGIERAVLNLGGNIYVIGSKTADTPWSVGIQNPFEPSGELMGILRTTDRSVVTSGSYERFFEKDGKKYHHILDPDNGYPIDNTLVSVSIVSDKSVDGDILSTSAFSLGLDEGRTLINSLENTAAIFITKDKEIYYAGDRTLLSDFELKDTDFIIKE